MLKEEWLLQIWDVLQEIWETAAELQAQQLYARGEEGSILLAAAVIKWTKITSATD